MAGAAGGDDTRTLRVSVEPFPADAALGRVAAVDGRGVNVLAAPLAQGDLVGRAPLPLLPSRTLCKGGGGSERGMCKWDKSYDWMMERGN